MQKRLQRLLLVLAVGALVGLRAQPAAAPAAAATPQVDIVQAQIVAARVTGEVTMKVAAQVSKLQNNDVVPQSAIVSTGGNSSVVLIFSNGASTQLGANTELVIEQFLQDPFSSSVKLATLEEEPSVSKTKIRLNRGELVGNVKKLHRSQGSEFTVETPVGAAGIRGTTFRIVFTPTGDGRFNFSISTVEGNVHLTSPNNQNTNNPTNNNPTTNNNGTGNNANNGANAGLSVSSGNEIVVLVNATVTTTPQGTTTIKVDSASVTLPTAPSAIPNVTNAQITSVASTLLTTAATTSFTTSTSSNQNLNATGTQNNSTGTSGQTQQQTQTQNQNENQNQNQNQQTNQQNSQQSNQQTNQQTTSKPVLDPKATTGVTNLTPGDGLPKPPGG